MINSIAFRPLSFAPTFSIPAFSDIKAHVQRVASKAIARESLPAASLLQVNEITVLPDAINKVFNGCMAAGWGVLGGIVVLSLLGNIGDLSQAIKLDPSDPQKARKVAAHAKKVFIDSTFIGGVVANTIEWAHSVNWIVLGRLASAFKMAGFGSSIVIAGIGTADAVRDIYIAQCGVDVAATEDLKEKEREKRRLGLLNLIWNVSSVAWGVLGCAAILGGITISPVITGGLLAIGCVMWVLAYAYRQHKGLDEGSCLLSAKPNS